jgi:predicted Zn-dependent protease
MTRCPPLFVATLILLLAQGPLPAQEITNPELFTKSLKVAHQALQYYGPYHDPDAAERVAEIGYRIAQESGYGKFPFTFHLIDMPVPNAFALPAGQIFVTRGMLDLGLNDDMLASLLGHEIGHVVLNHGLRMQRKATLLNILSQALMVGVLVGSDGGGSQRSPTGYYDDRRGSKVQGAAAAGMVVSELLLRDYSREFETEADDEGQRWAAGAGFDPDGARQLWALMNTRIPTSKEYGYWRTHPFSDIRERAANTRAELLTIQTAKSADNFRMATQKALVSYLERGSHEPELVLVLKGEILTAWPRGATAEQIRLEYLHRQRETELDKATLSRDYGRLIRAYGEQIQVVSELTPETPFLEVLNQEVEKLGQEARSLHPKALEVLDGGVFETSFLEAFLSNYPDAPEVPRAAMALAQAYSRLRNQTEAVTLYLKAWLVAPDSEEGKRALTGLRNLTPVLGELSALQQLAEQEDDPELRELAATRLGALAPEYEDPANGAEYLKRFPGGPQSGTVNERLNFLAEELYAEMVIYQGVGDHAKALERIHDILTHAPLSPAADRLREQAVAIMEG